MLEHHRYGIVNHCDYPIIQEKSKGWTTRSKSSNEKLMASMIYATFHWKIFRISTAELEKNLSSSSPK
jgi:hypothetical protein